MHINRFGKIGLTYFLVLFLFIIISCSCANFLQVMEAIASTHGNQGQPITNAQTNNSSSGSEVYPNFAEVLRAGETPCYFYVENKSRNKTFNLYFNGSTPGGIHPGQSVNFMVRPGTWILEAKMLDWSTQNQIGVVPVQKIYLNNYQSVYKWILY